MPSSEYQGIVQRLRSLPRLADFELSQQRLLFERITSQFPALEGMRCDPVQIDGLAAEWIAPPGASRDRVIHYLHGGGYCIGSLASHRALIARLAAACGARALAVEYRLAPEHPFPAAIEDAAAAYRWLLASGIDPSRIVIAGDSGGGGLAVATLLALRDAGDPLPAAAVCMSPWLDLACQGPSIVINAGADLVVTRAWLETLAAAYLAGADARAPLASPVYADLTGLPPTLLQVGSTEILLDDATRFARRAQAAGVSVTLDIWQGMFHFWQAFAAELPEGRQAIDRIGAFVRRHVPAEARE